MVTTRYIPILRHLVLSKICLTATDRVNSDLQTKTDRSKPNIVNLSSVTMKQGYCLLASSWFSMVENVVLLNKNMNPSDHSAASINCKSCSNIMNVLISYANEERIRE